MGILLVFPVMQFSFLAEQLNWITWNRINHILHPKSNQHVQLQEAKVAIGIDNFKSGFNKCMEQKAISGYLATWYRWDP